MATLPGSNFEIDVNANLKVDDGKLDWADVAEVRKSDLTTGSNDDSYSGGAKEDDTCPSVGTGSIPNNKSDLLSFATYVETGSPGFLHLFWTRVQEPSGTTLMDFELNQSSITCNNGVNKQRTTGDLLIEYSIDQGGASAKVLVREWTGSAWGPSTDLTATGKATGTINSTAIPASESDGLVTAPNSVSARTFGEASLDLSFLFNPNDPCTTFGSAFLKSRSSTSFTSQLKDFIAPVAINISNCGSIKIIKQTDPDGSTTPFGFSTTGGLTPSTFSLSDGGEQLFSNVLQGSYSVSENAPTVGEFVNITCTNNGVSTTNGIDNTLRKVTFALQPQDNYVCTFNNRLRGSILVRKIDSGGQPLGGAGFTITPGNIVMNSPSTGVFCTENLAFGQYTVTESTVPAGYNGAAPQNVTISSTATCAQKATPDLTFTNSPAPGRINISKTDDAGTPLNGAVFTLFSGTTVVGTCTTGVSNHGAPGTPPAGTCSFINVPLGTYTVDETGVPDGYSKAAGLPAVVVVDFGTTAGTGQTVNLPSPGTSYVDPRTHKVIVIVCHQGTNTLAPSDVMIGMDTFTSTGSVLFATDAQLCGLNGVGGKGHGTTAVTVEVGSDAH